MKKQFVLLALGMMLVGGVAHADLNSDPNIPNSPASVADKAAHPGCPLALGSTVDRDSSSSPTETADAGLSSSNSTVR